MNKQDLIAPETYNIVSEIEKFTADQYKKAVIFENETGENREITYNNLIKNANKVGNMFLKYGFKKGDKVLIMMPRCIETYEVYLAALKLGIIIIPSSEMLRTKDLQYRITHGEVKGIVIWATEEQTQAGLPAAREFTYEEATKMFRDNPDQLNKLPPDLKAKFNDPDYVIDKEFYTKILK